MRKKHRPLDSGYAVTLLLTLIVGFSMLVVLFTVAVGVVHFASSALVVFSTPTLLMIIAILLFLLVILLIVFLWHCFFRAIPLPDLSLLLNALPQLQEIRAALEATAQSLTLMAGAMRAASAPLKAAGDAATLAGEKINISIPTIEPVKEEFPAIGLVVTGFSKTNTYPLSEASNQFTLIGGKMSGDGGVSAQLNTMADQCTAAAAGLRRVREQLQIS